MEFDNVETVKRAIEINAECDHSPNYRDQEAAQGLLKIIPFKNGTYTRPLALIHRAVNSDTAMKKLSNS